MALIVSMLNGRLVGVEHRVITTTDSVLSTDFFLRIEEAGAIDVTLPDITTVRNHIFVLKKVNNNGTVTIKPNGSDTIDDGATLPLTTQKEAINVWAPPTGTNWEVW